MRIFARQNATGYTLVEVLLVVMIVGMLAAMIVPKYDLQRKKAAVNATKANLEVLRTAVAVYYETEGSWPAGNLLGLINSPTGVQYLGAIPKEAITDQNRVVNISDYNGGWVYETATHVIRLNVLGNDVNGTPYNTY